VASSHDIQYEPGRACHLRTDEPYVIRVPTASMTIAFLLESRGQVAQTFPRYVLRSSDGAYDEELSAKNDLVPGDAYLQLKFEKLLPGKRYTLTRFDDVDLSHVIFEDVPFREVVDQPRGADDVLVAHAYGEFQLANGGDRIFDDWPPDEGSVA